MRNNKIISYILAMATLLGLVYLVMINAPGSSFNFHIYAPYSMFIFRGLLWALLVSILAFVFSFGLGALMFFASRSKSNYVKSLISIYTDFMFGTPLLVIVFAFYFFVGAALNVDSKLLIGIVSLTLYFAPFMMKLFISAYSAIDMNQIIVCDIFGFTKFQMYRYILFPQMLRIMLPPLSGQLAIIIKGSALLYVTGFGELFYNLTKVQSTTFAYTEGFILMMVLYLIITVPLLKLTAYLERRMKI